MAVTGYSIGSSCGCSRVGGSSGVGSCNVAAIVGTRMIMLPVSVAAVTFMFSVPVVLLSIAAFAVADVTSYVVDSIYCSCCGDGVLYWKSKS
jgi:hypothetical protein